MNVLRKGKITFRLMIIITFICLLPILILTSYFEQYYSQKAEERTIESSKKLLNIVDNVMTEEMNKVRYLGDVLAMSDVVQYKLAEPKEATPFEQQEVMMMQELIYEVYAISTMIKEVGIASLDGRTLFSTGYYFLTEEENRKCIENVEENAPLEYVTAAKSSAWGDTFMVCRAINSSEIYNKRLGYLIIVLNEDVFSQKVFDGVDCAAGDLVFAYSPQKQVVASNGAYLPVGSEVPQKMLTSIEAMRQADGRELGLSVDNKSYIGSSRYNPQVGWTEVMLTDLSALENEKEGFRIRLLSVAAVCGIGAILGVLAVSQTIIRPLKKILHFVRESERGENVELTDPAKDEIGYLARHTQAMVTQLRRLEAEQLREAEQRRILELRFLQTQISPHFLFNILNNFKWIASLNEVPALEKGLSSLALLLRSSIMSTEEQIPLRAEIDNLQHYFYIQSLINPGRLEFTVHAQEECMSLKIPKLLLQPLMENSILHGMRSNGETLHLNLEVCRQDSSCLICFSDDGAGCDPSQLDARKNTKENHIGVDNIRQRISLIYHERGEFLFESRKEEGTVVRICIPFEEENTDV